MSTSNSMALNQCISWFFLAYFAVLFAERAQSVIRSVRAGVSLYGSAFHGFVYTAVFLSLGVTVVLLAGFNGDFWRSLTHAVVPDYSLLTVTAGVLLVSGMVHTEYTVAPVQFASYGMLIVAMVLRTVQVTSGAAEPWKFWYSLVFLTVFSMAIPVMYESHIKEAGVFHVIEAISALLLVFFFTYLLRMMFLGEGSDLLLAVPVLIATACDAAVIALRWQEKVNGFVLVFIVLTVVIFALGKVLFAVRH